MTNMIKPYCTVRSLMRHRYLKTEYNKANVNAYIQLAFSNFQIKKIKGDVCSFPIEKSMKCND